MNGPFESLVSSHNNSARIIYNKVFLIKGIHVHRNLVVKRSDITKPCYNKVILFVPVTCVYLYFVFFYPV